MNTNRSVITRIQAIGLAFSLALPVGAINAAPPVDHRTLVDMPAAETAQLRSEMQQNLLVLNQTFGYLANKEYAQAAALIEQKMGKSAQGNHTDPSIRPGQHMPDPMRKIAWVMHSNATALAETLKGGDETQINAGMQTLLGSCAACHLSYRIR
jgi:mono/diheme cytochrome c family protein